MVLYKDGAQVSDNNTVTTQIASPDTYIGRFDYGLSFKGAIDNAMIFDRALTAAEISALYNGGNGTETLSESHHASYTANGWSFDVNEDIAVKVDFHYSGVSTTDGWMGMSIGDDVNYVSISVGSDNDASYYYYEAVVDGNPVFEQEPRTADDGTLYVSYDSASKTFYLSHTGFGSGNAYVGQWALPVKSSIGGGSSGATLSAGEAYLDNFEVVTSEELLLNWPPITDIDTNGFIELDDFLMMCENWLYAGAGDFDNNEIVDFYDFAEFGLAW